jgi:hypothetical protein
MATHKHYHRSTKVLDTPHLQAFREKILFEKVITKIKVSSSFSFFSHVSRLTATRKYYQYVYKGPKYPAPASISGENTFWESYY